MMLKEIRESKGLSRKELSQTSGINLRTLQDYEQGHKAITSIKGETLYRLSLALGCTMEEILDPQFITVIPEEKKDYQRLRRLLNYQLKFSITKSQVEQTRIYSQKYKVYGKWILNEKTCNLIFLYAGEIVQLPFNVPFAADKLPWLVEVAILTIDNYIEEVKFQKKCAELAGDLWNEWEKWDDG